VFTDVVGATTLQSDRPAPASRFAGWTALSNPQGEAGHTQSVGARAMNRTSWRHGVAFTVPGLRMGAASGSSLDIADRLCGHLLKGGTCQVITEDALGSSYATCGLMPDTMPTLRLADRRTLEYELTIALINLATNPVAMHAYYGITHHPITATGGTITDITIDGVKYRVHTFTSSGTLVVTAGSISDAEVLIVGGGGAGGGSTTGTRGGGGAGGGRKKLTGQALAVGSYVVVVGDGGVSEGNLNSAANDGGNSSFGAESATGGGGGAAGNNAGRNGGSGGGGRSSDFQAGTAGGTGTGGEGNNGGAGGFGLGVGGGGGGADAAGAAASSGGAGGAGDTDDISGTPTEYGKGGNGGGHASGGAGAANTGNGGKGASGASGVGSAGGKGVVIVRYRR
jgi:hypothetical protein